MEIWKNTNGKDPVIRFVFEIQGKRYTRTRCYDKQGLQEFSFKDPYEPEIEEWGFLDQFTDQLEF